MTKSLTEKWKDGELPCGAYYVNRLGEMRVYLLKYEDEKNTHEIYEVLAPVPSYEEYKQLQERLAIATKALNETKDMLLKVELSNLKYEDRHKLYDLMFADGVIDKALKEIEEVK